MKVDDYYVSPAVARRVWAAVSRNPHCTVRGLARALGVSKHAVQASLHALYRLGYLAPTPSVQGGRRVVVPFIDTSEAL